MQSPRRGVCPLLKQPCQVEDSMLERWRITKGTPNIIKDPAGRQASRPAVGKVSQEGSPAVGKVSQAEMTHSNPNGTLQRQSSQHSGLLTWSPSADPNRDMRCVIGHATNLSGQGSLPWSTLGPCCAMAYTAALERPPGASLAQPLACVARFQKAPHLCGRTAELGNSVATQLAHAAKGAGNLGGWACCACQASW